MAEDQQSRKPRILVCAGSARADSLHRQLAQAAQAALEAAGADASFVEIGDYDLPLYNQDIEEKQGDPHRQGLYVTCSSRTMDWHLLRRSTTVRIRPS